MSRLRRKRYHLRGFGFIDELDEVWIVRESCVVLNLLKLFIAETEVSAFAAVHEDADVSVTAEDFIVPFHSGFSCVIL